MWCKRAATCGARETRFLQVTATAKVDGVRLKRHEMDETDQSPLSLSPWSCQRQWAVGRTPTQSWRRRRGPLDPG